MLGLLFFLVSKEMRLVKEKDFMVPWQMMWRTLPRAAPGGEGATWAAAAAQWAAPSPAFSPAARGPSWAAAASPSPASTNLWHTARV